MRLLVLGGTRFVGRAMVEAAIARGHDVTLFNRGTRGTTFPDVRTITGDRDVPDELLRIADAECDVLLDVSGYRPAQVRPVCDALGSRMPHYVYVSTVSVYADPVPPGADEDAPLATIDEAEGERDPRAAYGALKALCEMELRRRVERLTVVRPTVVIGPHDTTDRFPWWVRAIRGGETVRVPRVEQPLQLIDADDLAAFTLQLAEDSVTGTFNAAGPAAPLTLAGLATELRAALGGDGVLAVGDDETVPLTLPSDGASDGVFQVSASRAAAAGLVLRPIADSARAVSAA